jgi:hypothetical protein
MQLKPGAHHALRLLVLMAMHCCPEPDTGSCVEQVVLVESLEHEHENPLAMHTRWEHAWVEDPLLLLPPPAELAAAAASATPPAIAAPASSMVPVAEPVDAAAAAGAG